VQRRCSRVFSLAAIAGAVWVSAAHAQEARFEPLFDGRSLAGWVEMGAPGAFAASSGELHLRAPQNHPNWLRTEREYENYVLRLEYLVTGWAEGGILLHAPLHGDLPATGYKLHVRHDQTPPALRSAGALYDLVPPLATANKGPKEWNALEVRMDWPSLRVTLNGVRIHDILLDATEELRWKPRRGYIGLEDLGFEVRYRNLAIQELPSTDVPWTPLFNGTDLKGWTPQGAARWAVEEGGIVGSSGDGFLVTDEAFEGFDFQVYFRSSRHANGGVYFRRGEGFPGYEVQIYNVPGATYPTGSIYAQVPAASMPCRDGEWCMMRIVSAGAHARVWVNGRLVAASWSLSRPDGGRIAFQNHSEGRIEYRDPRIRRVRPAPLPSRASP